MRALKNISRINPDDELFRFLFAEWNITKLLEQIKKSELPATVINVTQLTVQNNMIVIDGAYAMQTDLCRPLVMVELQKNKYFLADGHHRLYKAEKTGAQSLQVYYVPFDIHINCVTEKKAILQLRKIHKAS